MNDLELMRLYLLYKAGSVQDGNKNSDLLQVAKATASDLTEEEFAWLSREVENLGSIRESQNKDSRNSAGTSKNDGGGWNVWRAAKSFAMGSSEYQKRLWELPDLVRSDKPFVPSRLADGNPIDLDPSDPEGSQERLRAQPYNQVKHDPKLRDAWHAAQSGKFADMLRGNDVWQAFTDPKLFQDGAESAKPVRSSLSAPLRSLLSSMDSGELDWRLNTAAKAYGRDLPTHSVYQQDPNELIAGLTGPDSLTFQRKITDSKANMTPTSVPFRDVMESKKEEDVRKWVHEAREHHEKTVRQTLVDYQIKGYRPKVAQGVVEDPLNLPGSGNTASPVGKGIDALQTALDAGGVVDPTPIVDGLNAGISVVRAFTDPQNAGKHLVNAGISAVGMVPYLGDLAKIFKYGGKAAKAGESVSDDGGGIAGAIGSLFGGGSGGGGGAPDDPNGDSGESGGTNWRMVGGIAASAIGLIAAFKALGSWIGRTVANGEQLLESQRNLARYSGEISNAFAKYDTAGVFREIRNAEYLGSSVVGLAGAQADLKDATAFRDAPSKRFSNDFGNVMAQVATIGVYVQTFTDFKSLVLRGLYSIVDAVKDTKSDDPRSGLEALFQKMDADKAAEEAKKNPQKQPARLPADGVPQFGAFGNVRRMDWK